MASRIDYTKMPGLEGIEIGKLMPDKRMLEVLLRGAHKKGAMRDGIAAALGKRAADIVWVSDPGEIVHFGLDVLVRSKGFRTQVTLICDPAEVSRATNNLELARLLAGKFNDDALVLEDPTRPGEETFHGLLARPNGTVYRVPLKELSPEGMDIGGNAAQWTEWQPRH